MKNLPLDESGRELIRLVEMILDTGDYQAIRGMLLNATAYMRCVEIRREVENMSLYGP